GLGAAEVDRVDHLGGRRVLREERGKLGVGRAIEDEADVLVAQGYCDQRRVAVRPLELGRGHEQHGLAEVELCGLRNRGRLVLRGCRTHAQGKSEEEYGGHYECACSPLCTFFALHRVSFVFERPYKTFDAKTVQWFLALLLHSARIRACDST